MLDRLYTKLDELLVFAGIAFVFGIIKVSTSQSKMPVSYKVGSVAISVLIGTLAGEVAIESNVGDFLALSIASFASLIARDAVHAILDKKFVGDLTKRAAENLVDKVTK